MGVVNFLFVTRFSMELANQSVNARIKLFFSLCFGVSLYKQKVSLKYNYFGNDACTFQENNFPLEKVKASESSHQDVFIPVPTEQAKLDEPTRQTDVASLQFGCNNS